MSTSNKNHYYIKSDEELEQYLIDKGFKPGDDYPPRFILEYLQERDAELIKAATALKNEEEHYLAASELAKLAAKDLCIAQNHMRELEKQVSFWKNRAEYIEVNGEKEVQVDILKSSVHSLLSQVEKLLDALARITVMSDLLCEESVHVKMKSATKEIYLESLSLVSTIKNNS